MSPTTTIFGRAKSLRPFEKSLGFFQMGEGSWQSFEGLFPSPKNRTKYTYDMFNNLIGRTVNGVARYFVYDGTNMVLAFNGSQELTDRYLSGPAVDQVLADECFASPTSQLPSAAGTTLWMLGDNQGSVTDVVGDSGTPYEHIDYSPFGVQNVTVENTPPTRYVLPFGYTGTYTDPSTGYQLHGVRWYDPSVGRWLSEDPSGLSAGPNPYEYCGNGPTDGTDPSGLQPPLPELAFFTRGPNGELIPRWPETNAGPPVQYPANVNPDGEMWAARARAGSTYVAAPSPRVRLFYSLDKQHYRGRPRDFRWGLRTFKRKLVTNGRLPRNLA